MSSNPTSCCICTKKVSFQGINKHFFSKTHRDDLKNALFKRKALILSQIDKAKPISIFFKSQSKCFNICYPCKYLGNTMNDHTCKKEEENRKIIKEILNSMTEPIMREGEEKTIDLVIEAKPGELATLNMKVKRLQGTVDRLQAVADRALDLQDILSAMLEELKENDFESFKSRMIKIKRDNPEIFSKMYKELGGEEGKEDEFDEVDQEEVEVEV